MMISFSSSAVRLPSTIGFTSNEAKVSPVKQPDKKEPVIQKGSGGKMLVMVKGDSHTAPGGKRNP